MKYFLYLADKILMVAGIHCNYHEKKLGHGFWNLTELLDSNVKIEDVSNRIIEISGTCNTLHLQGAQENCAIVGGGSTVLTTEGQSLVSRSFWP